ncbi:MAG TPA: hypothetical protein VGM59_14580 [Dongiaceae bacterium]|jgi:hypothetical protein
MTDDRNLPDRIEPHLGPEPEGVPARVYGRAVDAGYIPAPLNPPTLLEELRPWSSRPPAGFSPPVFGALAVIFGVTAFYKATLLLAPLGLLAGFIACLRRQWGWGLIGILSALAALAIDPYVWGLAGLYWLARVLGLLG